MSTDFKAPFNVLRLFGLIYCKLYLEVQSVTEKLNCHYEHYRKLSKSIFANVRGKGVKKSKPLTAFMLYCIGFLSYYW